MPVPASIRGTQVYIKIGNGASPEAFFHPCLINTQRGIQFQSNGQDVEVPDCDDPEAPAWTEHEKSGLSATISGAGVLDTAAIAEFDAWFRSPDAKNVQIWANTHGHWAGAFKLVDWQIGGDRGGVRADAQITLKSHGIIAPYDPA